MQPKFFISGKDRLQALRLAETAEKRGQLAQFVFYGMPGFGKGVVNKHRITGMMYYPFLKKVFAVAPLFSNSRFQMSLGEYQKYNRACKKVLDETEGADIFLSKSFVGPDLLIKAKQKGMVVFLYKPGIHPKTEQRLMQGQADTARTNEYAKRISDLVIDEINVADYILIPSEFVKQTFIENGVLEDKLVIVRPSIDTGVFVPSEKSKKQFKVMFAGDLSIEKGPHFLMQTMAELGNKDIITEFYGAVQDELKPFIEKYNLPNIKVKGPRPHQWMPIYYQQASVFVLPSLSEGLSLAILEALACGVPVIATKNSGAENVIKEGYNGYILKDDFMQTGELKSLIENMYKNKDTEAFEQLGINATRSAQPFSIENSCNDLLDKVEGKYHDWKYKIR